MCVYCLEPLAGTFLLRIRRKIRCPIEVTGSPVGQSCADSHPRGVIQELETSRVRVWRVVGGAGGP